jgi:hypothetical protein
MYGNQAKITCIDNWSEFGGPRDQFFANVEAFANARTEFAFLETDFRSVDFTAIGKHNVYFFDGPHSYQDQFDGVVAPLAALDREWVFIVDDWNAEETRAGTRDGLNSRGLEPLYAIEIRTTQDGAHADCYGGASDWHNGSFLAVFHGFGEIYLPTSRWDAGDRQLEDRHEHRQDWGAHKIERTGPLAVATTGKRSERRRWRVSPKGPPMPGEEPSERRRWTVSPKEPPMPAEEPSEHRRWAVTPKKPEATSSRPETPTLGGIPDGGMADGLAPHVGHPPRHPRRIS